jgi:hypothetical protein
MLEISSLHCPECQGVRKSNPGNIISHRRYNYVISFGTLVGADDGLPWVIVGDLEYYHKGLFPSHTTTNALKLERFDCSMVLFILYWRPYFSYTKVFDVHVIYVIPSEYRYWTSPCYHLIVRSTAVRISSAPVPIICVSEYSVPVIV